MAPPTVRRAPYRDFLQPTLQRRFASTALVLLAVAYVESLLLSPWNSFLWSWFPIGPAGLRTLIIFSCTIFIVILRIAHPHLGLRTTNSPISTFYQHAPSLATSETILTYTISAFLFSQVYLFSIGEKANLQWIVYHSGDRARVNERALFYTVSLSLLGLFEGFMHLFLDYDRLILGAVKARSEKTAGASPPKAEDPFEKLLKQAPVLLIRSITTSITIAWTNYIVGYSLLRGSAWGWAMTFLRPFYNLPKSNIPPSSAPWSFWMLWRSILAGTLLCLLWNFSNTAFTYRLAKEPVKNGKPLTAESKDPNGSLLNGLKSKKPRIAAFAMWELALIARDYDERRKAIFEDIDRKDGPMWSQIYALCLETIKTLEQRVDAYSKPAATEQIAPTKPEEKRKHIVEPPSSADVWLKAQPPSSYRGSLGKFVNDVVRSPGKKPSETVVPFAMKTVAEVKDHLLTKQQQEHLNPESIFGAAQSIIQYLVQVPYVGYLFRQPYSNRLATAVLGTPYGDASLYINSVFALSQLAVKSLAEDKYGNVHRDVPAIIRTITTVVKKLEVFEENIPIHWTDTTGQRRCEPVEAVLDALKDALARVVEAFEPYGSDLRLTRTDFRLAKEAAEKKQRAPELARVEGKEQEMDAKREEPETGRRRQRTPEMRQLS
ncbi:nucleoporin protein Ndc1-Nup [Pseudomassariella vexata]|uniref:Nucleoporin protein Ndc1-Nup n=1 Tax=Pseudomassariella vexata TaxID=1141098 RepID=A0A1Y2DL85_9PEZI|nr:nucleoporin protein Ndc1-Nup [Pseudomassariella vexata]ORY59997.1 nucleoporin protein Ndc1-Nup [Pseudomassariella vexata]